jgi:hypothetical protein
MPGEGSSNARVNLKDIQAPAIGGLHSPEDLQSTMWPGKTPSVQPLLPGGTRINMK